MNLRSGVRVTWVATKSQAFGCEQCEFPIMGIAGVSEEMIDAQVDPDQEREVGTATTAHRLQFLTGSTGGTAKIRPS